MNEIWYTWLKQNQNFENFSGCFRGNHVYARAHPMDFRLLTKHNVSTFLIILGLPHPRVGHLKKLPALIEKSPLSWKDAKKS